MEPIECGCCGEHHREPELLEALKDATDYCRAQAHRHKGDSTFAPFLERLEQAIAKAERGGN